MAEARQTLRQDALGQWTGAYNWTGESQAIAFTDTVATTEITLSNLNDLVFVATQDCHINLGARSTINDASATVKNRCYFIKAGVYVPIYVPEDFMRLSAGGTRQLHISIVRNSANGTLYISNAIGTSTPDYNRATTTSSTTTTTTTTTSTTT